MNPPIDVVRTEGDGPGLLLIHGTATDSSSWDVLVRLLRDRVRVTTYDRRGSGRWPLNGKPTPPSVADHAADAADIITSLDTGGVYICGMSFGGAVALELLRTRPHLIRGAALFEPALATDDRVDAASTAFLKEYERLVNQGNGSQAAELFHRRALSSRGWALLPADVKAQACSQWEQIHWDLIAGGAYRPPYDELERLDVPVLLLRGGRSSPAFELSLKALSAVLRRSQTRTLEHAGHRVSGQAWQELATALTAFMEL